MRTPPPFEKDRTTCVLPRISRISRSIALLVPTLLQCSLGNRVWVKVSAYLSRTTVEASSGLVSFSGSKITSRVLASAAPRDFMA